MELLDKLCGTWAWHLHTILFRENLAVLGTNHAVKHTFLAGTCIDKTPKQQRSWIMPGWLWRRFEASLHCESLGTHGAAV